MSLTARLKRFKFTHWIYNLIHYKKLLHNREAYKKYHINRPLIASISSKDFPDKSSGAWLDRGYSGDLVGTREAFRLFDPGLQAQLLKWSDNGFILLENFLDEKTVRLVNREIDILTARQKLVPTHDHKLMFANRVSGLIRHVTYDRKLTGILDFILDKEVIPFQTINFLVGSNQRAHSDSIHMTTYPLGYLIAVWIALEDIDEDSGPLFYYPGSHRLPFLLNGDYNTGETLLTLGKKEYSDYEDLLEELIGQQKFEKKVLLARKGDILIWHANLVHGGMPVKNPALSRKSMVIHYYAKDVIKYHEISERPSLI